MIRYAAESKLSAEQVVERATAFFGPGGVGLSVTEQGPACARFVGGGGYVSLSLCRGEKLTQVEIEAREWEHQAGEFLKAI